MGTSGQFSHLHKAGTRERGEAREACTGLVHSKKAGVREGAQASPIPSQTGTIHSLYLRLQVHIFVESVSRLKNTGEGGRRHC